MQCIHYLLDNCAFLSLPKACPCKQVRQVPTTTAISHGECYTHLRIPAPNLELVAAEADISIHHYLLNPYHNQDLGWRGSQKQT